MARTHLQVGDAGNFGQSGVNYLCKVQSDIDFKKIDKEFQFTEGFWRMFRCHENRADLSLN
jgi:hypothetical protein